MANNDMQGSIPRIDFTGIDPAAGPSDARWTTVRAAVMDALLEHGCFEAVMDTSFLAVLTQNDIDGVEVECGRGEGGWARPALHRVVMSGDQTRYSSILFSSPKDDVIVRAIEEAVHAEHPAIYRPFEYGEYVVFCYKPEMVQHPNKLTLSPPCASMDRARWLLKTALNQTASV